MTIAIVNFIMQKMTRQDDDQNIIQKINAKIQGDIPGLSIIELSTKI
jgi:hypothetical protein